MDTTLPIARAILRACVGSPVKAPWRIDQLNLTLGLEDFARSGIRVTENQYFRAAPASWPCPGST
jgi:hypothetical protein